MTASPGIAFAAETTAPCLSIVPVKPARQPQPQPLTSSPKLKPKCRAFIRHHVTNAEQSAYCGYCPARALRRLQAHYIPKCRESPFGDSFCVLGEAADEIGPCEG